MRQNTPLQPPQIAMLQKALKLAETDREGFDQAELAELIGTINGADTVIIDGEV